MIRLVGAAFLAMGCAWLGFQAAENLRRRCRSLRQMAQTLRILEQELELGAPPLPQLLGRAAERSKGPGKKLLEGCVRGLDELEREEFSALWRRLVSGLEELGPEGRGILAPLGDVLGRYDSRAQEEGVAAVRCRLEELAERGEVERRQQGRVYQALGLSGGAFLVILLL